MAKKDVFIKDEGDFVTVIFESKLSQKIVNKESAEVKEKLQICKGFNGEPIIKLDILRESVSMIHAWLVSHSLSFEQDL
jgi:hypothetical protein